MTTDNIETALARAEEAVSNGRSLRGTGFWRAVDDVKRNASLVERYADRIATIDRRAFENGVKLRIRTWVGVLGLLLVTAVGVAGVTIAYLAAVPGGLVLWSRTVGPNVDGVETVVRESVRRVGFYGTRGLLPIAFVVGFGALLVGTHCLAHLIVGRLAGIRFTHVFLGGPPPPRPGLKTDYGTYLRASPRARAAMHASGAVLTKIVPFALLPVSLSFYDGWPWLTWILLAVGVLQIVTDIVLSTKVSDWKKVLRELRIARGGSRLKG